MWNGYAEQGPGHSNERPEEQLGFDKLEDAEQEQHRDQEGLTTAESRRTTRDSGRSSKPPEGEKTDGLSWCVTAELRAQAERESGSLSIESGRVPFDDDCISDTNPVQRVLSGHVKVTLRVILRPSKADLKEVYHASSGQYGDSWFPD